MGGWASDDNAANAGAEPPGFVWRGAPGAVGEERREKEEGGVAKRPPRLEKKTQNGVRVNLMRRAAARAG